MLAAEDRAVHAVGHDVGVDCHVEGPAGAVRRKVHGPPLEPLPDPGEPGTGNEVDAANIAAEDRLTVEDVVLCVPLDEFDGHGVGGVPDTVGGAGVAQIRVPRRAGELDGEGEYRRG